MPVETPDARQTRMDRRRRLRGREMAFVGTREVSPRSPVERSTIPITRRSSPGIQTVVAHQRRLGSFDRPQAIVSVSEYQRMSPRAREVEAQRADARSRKAVERLQQRPEASDDQKIGLLRQATINRKNAQRLRAKDVDFGEEERFIAVERRRPRKPIRAEEERRRERKAYASLSSLGRDVE